jgi:hypothetical protein
MIVKESNLKEIKLYFNINGTIYAHKDWADRISDLISQLCVVIKLKYNLIIHTTSIYDTYNEEDNEKRFSIYFRQEDNKDMFGLKLELNRENELMLINWTTHDSSKQLRGRIPTTKTIKRTTIASGVNKRHFIFESYSCKSAKSSVELLEQVLKYV